MSIILALLMFSLIVIIHELGHFLLAKKNGIAVTEFSLGMGPRIFSKEIGETAYSLKLLPFGGSCLMVGEVAAGPVFNFILAFSFRCLLWEVSAMMLRRCG